LDELLAPGLDVDANALGSCIERVLEKFLYDGRRTLHHLAGSNLIGDIFGEDVDVAHAFRL
jgi:hypothetical protein